jgi:predicted ABC-type ATPase
VAQKQLWILAGGNGVGKSTFYDRYLRKHGILFVNADLIAGHMDSPVTPEISQRAQEQARLLCQSYMDEAQSFCFETVFSHVSKIDLVGEAKARGYFVVLVYIHLNLIELNQARVFQRVKDGGHDVPKDKIASRVPRAVKNVTQVLTLVDEARLFDNSFSENPFQQMAKIKAGFLVEKTDPLPEWAKEMLKAFRARID